MILQRPGILRPAVRKVLTPRMSLPAGSGVKGGPAAPAPPGAPAWWYDFSDTTTLWQDTGGTSAVTTTGDLIARADSKGSVLDNITQATETNRPSWTDAHVNLLGVATFDGVDNYMDITPSAGITDANGMTIMIVYSPAVNTSNDYILDWGGHKASHRTSNIRNTTTGISGAIVGASGQYSENEHVAIIIHDSGANTQEIRYSHDATDDTGTTNSNLPDITDDIHFGQGFTGNYYPGDMCEFLAYDAALVTGDRDLLETYATDKWGVIWA